MFQRQWTDSPPLTGPHANPPRNALISILKLLYWLADCWFGYLVTTRPARRNSRLVIYDRYLDDILIDPRRYRLPKPSLWFAKLIVHLAPRPDLYVLLDAPAEIVQQRKAEVLPAESQRQRLEYLEMFRLLPNSFIVNAAAPVDEVAGELKTVVLKSLTDRSVNRVEVSPMPTADLARDVLTPLLQDCAAGTATQEFLVVPGKGTPRWLLPARHHKIDPVLACWSPYRWKSRAKWLAIRAAHRTGFLSALPAVTRVYIPGVQNIDWRSVGWSGNASPVPLIYIGTPGISRKAVIHLVNAASGSCDVIVKAPLTEAARVAIVREADVLTTLADEDYTCAPRLLCVDQERGVAAQTALNGKVGSRKLTDSYWVLLRSLMLPGESTAIVGHAAEWGEQLLWAVGREGDISVMTAALSELCDPDPLPACWVHGDFAPWNIRHLPDGKVVLLDWEDGQRGGLPLQDAFHFLHMQDYLFGARPAVHATGIEPFARTIGIPPEQCRKLEIAYLAHSYLQRLAAGEAKHSEYLLETLRVVLQERHQLPAPTIHFPVRRSPELAEITMFSQPSRIRSDLFAAVIAQLNWAEIPYCVLSGHESHGNSSSDVDFMFLPRDAYRVAPLLAQAARGTGARIIQAMRHETSACYFVIAKNDGSEIGYFDPDCATDYRAQGRLWLSAEKVLARRRRCKGLYVPAVPDEFTYYLVKKVLKQSIADFQLRRLRHLYQRDPAKCREEILKFWSVTTVREVERALVASDLAWFRARMPGLLAELKASDPVEGLARRVAQKLLDRIRLVGRALRPTGMSVLVCGGEKKQQSAIVEGLLDQLAPAFRRTANLQDYPTLAVGLVPSLRLARKVLAARLLSTLVVSATGEGKLLTRDACPFTARMLCRPDLIFVLAGGEAKTFSGASCDADYSSTAGHNRTIYLSVRLSTEQNVQRASRTILRWLAARQERRLSPKGGHSADSSADSLAETLREPSGLHLVVK